MGGKLLGAHLAAGILAAGSPAAGSQEGEVSLLENEHGVAKIMAGRSTFIDDKKQHVQWKHLVAGSLAAGSLDDLSGRREITNMQ